MKDKKESPRGSILLWRYNQLKARVRRLAREFYQRIDRPVLSILGAYHGENVGDMALGNAIREIARQFGVRGRLQDLYRLSKQPVSDSIILGGGATGVETNISQLAEKYGGITSRTAMVGMDFSGDVGDFPEETLSYLQDVNLISCRSREQADKLGDVLGRTDVRFAYDNAFALNGIRREDISGNERVLGYNSLNLFMTWTGSHFEPGSPLEEWYRKIDSPILPYVKKIGPAYIRVLREALREYKRRYQIAHLPFTPEDDLFAKTYFRDLTDDFVDYSPDVSDVINRVDACDKLLATRYHSLVFGLMCRVPTIPVLYAVKCADLLDDLGVGAEYGVERTALVDKTEACVDKLVHGEPVVLDAHRLETIRKEVRGAIADAVTVVTQ